MQIIMINKMKKMKNQDQIFELKLYMLNSKYNLIWNIYLKKDIIQYIDHINFIKKKLKNLHK